MKLRQNITLKRQCHKILSTYFLPYETLNWVMFMSALSTTMRTQNFSLS